MTATAAALELAERQPTTEEISHAIKAANLQALVRAALNLEKTQAGGKPEYESFEVYRAAVEKAERRLFDLARSLEDNESCGSAKAVLQ